MVPLSWRVGSTELGRRLPAQINGGHTALFCFGKMVQRTKSGLSASFTLILDFDNLAMPQPVRSRLKACQRCQQTNPTLYRVVADSTGAWQLVCPACRASLEAQPFYRYGGTWKADKRH